MESKISNILGEQLFLAGDSSNIYRNGIISDSYDKKGNIHYGNYILWENVENVYIGGTVSTFNGIPSGENRTLTIVDMNNNKIVYSLSGSGFPRMTEYARQQFADAYSYILQNISPRQWEQFINKIRGGERLTFSKLEITKDAFYFHNLFGGYNKVDIAYIKGWNISQGYFYIQYQKATNILLTKNVGKVVNIPNIHIIQTYINLITNKH